MNNEPVAWMVKTLDGKNLMLYGDKQPPKFTGEVQYIPLYEHSEKTLMDDEFDNIFAMGKRLGVLETEDKFCKAKTLTDDAVRYQWLRNEYAHGRETYLAEGMPSGEKLDEYIDEQLRKAKEK
jgi:hypothetical protein